MDEKKSILNIKASHFGKGPKDLLDAFTKNRTSDPIRKLQEQSSKTLKALIQKKRFQEHDDIIKNNIKLKSKNDQIFGIIDEVSEKDGIGKVKTISASEFEELKFGKAEQHFGELNALMHHSKTNKGYVHYVNEDNPFMSKTIKFKYDFDKYQNDLTGIRKIESFIKKNNYSIINPLEEITKPILGADFAGTYLALQEAKSQSIVQAGLKANNPFIRNMRREARPVIEGMQHGWFGKARNLFTAFGSPFRLGDFADVLKITSEHLDYSFENQFGIDIETKSLDPSNSSVFQISLKKNKEYRNIFIQQSDNFNLEKYPFLHRTGIGQMNANRPIDFSRVQKIEKYDQMVQGLQPSFNGNIKSDIIKKYKANQEVRSFIEEAKAKNKNIFAMNANFEIKHLNTFFNGDTNFNYSDEYISLRKTIGRSNNKIMKDLESGVISEDEAFTKLVSNQKIKFTHMMNEALNPKGSVIEIQELAKTLNAVAQEKGLIPKTGRFSVGTNVEFLAKTLFGEAEFHEANLDNFIQGRLSRRVVEAIQEVESGSIKSNHVKNWIDYFNTNKEQIYYDTYLKSIKSTLEQGGSLTEIDPTLNRYSKVLSNTGLNEEKLFQKALDSYQTTKEYKTILKSNNAIGTSEAALQKVKVGSLLLGGVLLGSAITNLFKFSGRDDDANTIEGLQHGPIQSQRKNNTAFGSGYRMEKFHNQQQGQDPEGMQWGALATTGLGVGAYQVFKNKSTSIRLNDLAYLGALSRDIDNETLLGRKYATVQDVFVSGIRRFENSLGGFPKAFGIGNLVSKNMYDAASFSIDLTSKETESYAKYMDKLLKRNLAQEGVSGITFKNGELFLHKNGNIVKESGKFSLIKTVTDYNHEKSISSLAKSQLYSNGIAKTHHFIDQPFLITGGANTLDETRQFANAFLHETFSKPLKLLADPLEGLRELIPNSEIKVPAFAERILKWKGLPNIGLDGKELVTTWPEMLKKHGIKMAGVGAALYYGFGTLNWGAKQIGPDGTPVGDAGLVGLGASAIRMAHETYARFSDITGLTTLRNKVEEMAPGMDGWQSTVGLTLSGAMFGGLYGTLQDVAKEATAINKYEQFLKNAEKTEKFDGVLGKVFKGEMTNVSKHMKLGAAIGFALALPFTIAGLGAEKSAQELDDEYSGRKMVAVRKGRFWESSFTPWEGAQIDYYRPNWYAKLMDDAKNEELYGGDISPIGKTLRSVVDPYWLEKKRYFDQPYPITGPDGSMMGIFGPIYESTLGRVIKPVATMHGDLVPKELQNNTEYDLDAELRKQWNATLEFIGLRGFALGAVKENLTGSKEIFADPNEARSAKDIDSVVRDFYDLQLGGGILTTEALRRVFQNSPGFQQAQMNADINLNPLRNKMPSWMPGKGSFQDFQHGDPFLKIRDGYLRLPGEGYASRYEQLKGLNPEDYPDIFKYQILSDVAYGSREYRAVKGRLQNRELTDFEQNIFDEVQKQVDERNESKVNVRDPRTYDSFLGRYSAMVTDLARSNPLETLLPFSPAHKFLGPPSLEEYQDEKRYSKDYRNWSNPIDDFIMPSVSMTLNNLGIGGFNVNEEAQAQQYFDKVNYVKYSNLARDAQAKGDLKTADQYTLEAQKTYSGTNLYSHYAEVSKTLPTSERNLYTHFSSADLATKEQMLPHITSEYRDAYQAQYDRHLQESISRDHQISEEKRMRILKGIESRRSQMHARRKAAMQDFQNSIPDKDWKGWHNGVDINNVKNKYISNRARDYHNYTPRRNVRDNPNETSAANIEISKTNGDSLINQYASLNDANIQNTLVVIRPGLDNNVDANIEVNRTDERNNLLRDWGYTV